MELVNESKPKKIAQGSYGAVYRPAFKNKKNNGTNLIYPNEVTKVYFKKNTYNKALENAVKIKNAIGNDPGIKPYMHSYKKNNVKNIIKEENIAKHETADNGSMYMLHMPDLGIDLFNIMFPENIDKLTEEAILNIPFQIIKVIKQVKTLYDNELVHGDIRDVNIMIHPKTGNITIIDFDALDNRKVYFNKQILYSLLCKDIMDKNIKKEDSRYKSASKYAINRAGSYHTPPELLIKDSIQTFYPNKDGTMSLSLLELYEYDNARLSRFIAKQLDRPYLKYLKNFQNYSNNFPWKQMYSIPIRYRAGDKIYTDSISPLVTNDNVAEIITASTIFILPKIKSRLLEIVSTNSKDFNKLIESVSELLNEVFGETYDSYGLAGGLLCLLASLQNVFTKKLNEKYIEVYNTIVYNKLLGVILGMACPNYTFRISPTKALEFLEPIMKEYEKMLKSNELSTIVEEEEKEEEEINKLEIEGVKNVAKKLEYPEEVNTNMNRLSGKKRSRNQNNNKNKKNKNNNTTIKKSRQQNIPMTRQQTLFGGKRKTVRRNKLYI